MGNWKTKTYRLNELGVISRGRSRHRPRDDESLYGGEYPFVQTGDVKNANLHLTTYSQTYNKKGLAQSRLWKAGTLCITIAANIAETAILGIDACFPDSIVGFSPYEGLADVRYVKYYFDIYKKQMQAMALGATQDNLSVDKILKAKFIFPDFSTQTKIAKILSAYDDAIENNNRRIALLEKAARELYREWFARMRFPEHENAKFVDGLPERWEIKRVGEVVKLQRGHDLPIATMIEGKYPVIGSSGIIGHHDKLTTKPPVITLGRSGSIGSPSYYDFECWVHNTAIYAKKIKANSLWTFYMLCQIDYANLMGGSAVPTLNKNHIEAQKVVVPPSDVQCSFGSIINGLFLKMVNLQSQSQNLARQRDLLLPRLMSGKLEV